MKQKKSAPAPKGQPVKLSTTDRSPKAGDASPSVLSEQQLDAASGGLGLVSNHLK